MCMACVLSMLVQYYCSELPFPVIEGIHLVGSCVQSFTSGGKRRDRLQSDTVRTELAS